MAVIGRSFEQLNLKIKETQTQLKAAAKEASDFDKKLKLSPGNVDTVRNKYKALETQLQLTAQKTELLKQKQTALSRKYSDGLITEKQYNSQLASVAKEIQKTEQQTQELTTALSKQNAEIRNANFSNLINGLDKAKEKTEKLSKAALVLVGAIAAVLVSAAETGSELDDNAKKYDTTAEALQIMSNRYNYVTGNSDAYLDVLSKIGSMQTSIAAGRGTKYLTYLKQLGIVSDDLSNKTNAEIYELIEERLSEVTDSTERATIAQGLFGDVGLDVATMAATSAEEIQKWDDVLIENGLITNEQAATAAEAGDILDQLKTKYSAAAVEMLVELMPAFETFVTFLKDSVIPLITDVVGWFGNMSSGGQKFAVACLLMIIVLPKVITVIKGIATAINLVKTATYAQTVATGALTAASTPWLPIIIAISVALMMLITILGFFLPGGGVDDVIDNANSMLDSVNGLSESLDDLESDVSASATSTYETNSNKNLNISVDVTATGDTPISTQNAETISDALEERINTDLLNKELGEIIR